MGFWVYILQCADKSYYTGHTDNIEKRIGEHQTGRGNCYTNTRLPVKLVYADEFPTREEALSHERQVKGWSRKKKEALMRGDWKEISRLAQSSANHPSTGFLRQAQDERTLKSTVRPEPAKGRGGNETSTVRPEPAKGRGGNETSTVRPEPVEGRGEMKQAPFVLSLSKDGGK